MRLAPDQLAALVEIHRAVAGHLDRKTLFTAIPQVLQGVVPVDRLVLLVPGTDPSTLTVYAAYSKLGVEFYHETIPRSGSTSGWVVERGRPFLVGHAEDVRERFPGSYERLRRWGMESDAVLPLLTEGRCVGALSLMAEKADAWSGVSPVLLEEITASIAVAFDHCVAYEELRRLRDEQATLLGINRAVARHLNRDELFATLAECLHDLLPSDRFGIELPLAGDKLRAYVLAARNAKSVPAQVEELPAPGTACRWTEETRQWLIASSREELRERFPVTFDVMKREGMESLCAMPLLSSERCLGVLFFMAAREAAFQDLRHLLHQVGSAVAVALDHCLAYDELQERQAKIRRLVDANIIGVVIADLDGPIVEANDALLEMLGYSREDLLAGRLRWIVLLTERVPDALMPADRHAATQRAIEQIRATGRSETSETEYLRKDGSRVPALVGGTAFEESRTHAVFFVLDLSERRRSEEGLRRAHAELAHVTRVMTVGELTASIAHEVTHPSRRSSPTAMPACACSPATGRISARPVTPWPASSGMRTGRPRSSVACVDFWGNLTSTEGRSTSGK